MGLQSSALAMIGLGVRGDRSVSQFNRLSLTASIFAGRSIPLERSHGTATTCSGAFTMRSVRRRLCSV